MMGNTPIVNKSILVCQKKKKVYFNKSGMCIDNIIAFLNICTTTHSF